jgi:hypothetical protein
VLPISSHQPDYIGFSAVWGDIYIAAIYIREARNRTLWDCEASSTTFSLTPLRRHVLFPKNYTFSSLVLWLSKRLNFRHVTRCGLHPHEQRPFFAHDMFQKSRIPLKNSREELL